MSPGTFGATGEDWAASDPSMPRRVAVEVVEAGTHTDEHGVVHGSVTLWGSVEELAASQLGPAVLELGRPTCTRS